MKNLSHNCQSVGSDINPEPYFHKSPPNLVSLTMSVLVIAQ